MMTRKYKYITFWFFLAISACGAFAWAQDASTQPLARPVMEYKAKALRDPFKNYLTEDKSEPAPLEVAPVEKPQLDLKQFTVQGLIWGGRIPQAIINGRVLTIGDKIEEAEIVSIEKKGVTVSYNGALFDLPSPGISTPAPAADAAKK